MGAIITPRFKWMQREARRLAAAYDANTLWGATPYCWLRADTVTTSTGVDQMTDKSGNGRHFVQGTGSKQPALVAAGSDPNGFACVVSDGTDDSLTNAAFGALSAVTLYFATRSIVTPASAGYLLSIGNASDAQSVQVPCTTSGVLQCRYANPSSTLSAASIDVAAGTYTSSAVRITSVACNTAAGGASIFNARARLGATSSTAASAATGSTIANLAAALFASKTGGGSYLAAGLYEVIILDAAHTTEQMRLGELMLAGYYGLL